LPSLDKEIARGHEAERILRSPLWSEAWSSYEEKLMAAWRASGAKEQEQRETLWLAFQVCQKIKNHIESVMVTGRMASKQVEELNK
jgi:hypothetical protein